MLAAQRNHSGLNDDVLTHLSVRNRSTFVCLMLMPAACVCARTRMQFCVYSSTVCTSGPPSQFFCQAQLISTRSEVAWRGYLFRDCNDGCYSITNADSTVYCKATRVGCITDYGLGVGYKTTCSDDRNSPTPPPLPAMATTARMMATSMAGLGSQVVASFPEFAPMSRV